MQMPSNKKISIYHPTCYNLKTRVHITREVTELSKDNIYLLERHNISWGVNSRSGRAFLSTVSTLFYLPFLPDWTPLIYI